MFAENQWACVILVSLDLTPSDTSQLFVRQHKGKHNIDISGFSSNLLSSAFIVFLQRIIGLVSFDLTPSDTHQFFAL